jgi:hypothetical protein
MGRAPLKVPTFVPTKPGPDQARKFVDVDKLFATQRFVAGHQFGVVTTPHGAFVVDSPGVRGPLPVSGEAPLAAAMPVGKEGAVYLLTADGRAVVVPSLDAALAGERGVERKGVALVVSFERREPQRRVATRRDAKNVPRHQARWNVPRAAFGF